MPRSKKEEQTEEANQKELTPAQGAALMLRQLPGVDAVLKKFTDTELTAELKMPDERIIALLTESDKAMADAKEFEVKDDDSYQLAKAAADSLKDEADEVEAARTAGTKGINSLKAGWDAILMPGRKVRQAAAAMYHSKMRAYEAKRKQEEDERRRAAAEESARQRAELERQAAEKEKKADKLRTPAKKQELLQEAASLRSAAQSLPAEFSQTQVSVPSLGSGGKSERWIGTVTSDEEFLPWLWKNPLWIRKIIGDYMQSGLNDLAKQVKDGKEIPGFKAETESSYRREAKRKRPETGGEAGG